MICCHLKMTHLLALTALILALLSEAQSSPALNESQSIRKGTLRTRPSLEEYTKLRNEFVENQNSRTLGSDLTLTTQETKANKKLMEAKNRELEEGLKIPHHFTPSQNFFDVVEDIKKSELYKLLKYMPKGGSLHTHDSALCSLDYLIELTYTPDLWLCSDNNNRPINFIFAKETPPNSEICTWKLTKDIREELGAKAFDKHLRRHLSLYRKVKFEDSKAIWKQFTSIFILLSGLLNYAPILSEYYYQALREFYDDGVQYLEIRTTLPVLYDLNGTSYTNIDTARRIEDTLKRFKSDYPDFIGSKLIYSPVRSVEPVNLTEHIRTAVELKELFPNFFAGFDLVSQEALGKPLIEFLPQLLAAPENINFYFHAGETNWYGTTTDENVIDAVLLGTKRIGHGHSLIKHPAVLARLKENDIAIEVNPISNQVLLLVSDLRNHPCAHYFANNYPVVISSDDPSFWEATPATHDFYAAFLGIASARADLRLLKQLVINSIVYSAMDDKEKQVAFAKWQPKWDDFIARLLLLD